MTHLWIPGQPIKVRADPMSAPTAFRWEDQWHPVSRIHRRWRVDKGWWLTRIWREYFKLITETGLFVILYHNFLTGKWYLHRLYD